MKVLSAVVLALLCSFVTAQYYGSCSSSGQYTITTQTGELGCVSYGNQITRSWLIQLTDTSQRVMLTFDSFDTEANYDYVKIYDGSSSSASLLGSYAGTTIPPVLRSSGSTMYISFRSDQYVTGNGFHANFQAFQTAAGVEPCTTSFTSTRSLSGSTGSFGCDGYGNLVSDSWHITASVGERIVLNFPVFGTEPNYDFVTVYDGGSTSAQQVAHYSGNSPPPPVTASGNELYITFSSDYSLTGIGFTGSWTSLATAVDPCYSNSTNRIIVDPSGFIGCPYGYGNNVQSSWLIHPVGDVVIQLDFLSLDTQINHDTVSVYDGNSTSSHLIGTYSGTTTPARIVSSDSSLLIVFHTDSSVVQGGFTLTYRSYNQILSGGCARSGSYELTAETDTLGCDGYGNGATITWLITSSSPTDTVNLQFVSFNTESGHDVVSIYDGQSTSSPSLGSYSGTSIPGPVSSTGTHLFVQFVSDSNGVTGTGFSAVYNSVPQQTTTHDCMSSYNFHVTDLQGEIGCSGYGNSVSMSWFIDVPQGYIIYLTFDAFYTEANHDVLTVYDGTSNAGTVLGTFSGAQTPQPLTSNSNGLYLTFISDSSVTRLGFAAEYSTIFTGAGSCTSSTSHTLSAASDTFGCAGYSNSVTITWAITTVSNSRIAMEFTSFQTEYNYDFVKIYDGTSSSSPLLASYSGFSLPAPVQSTSNHLYVKFTADTSLNYDGFNANYNTITTTSIGACTTSTSSTLTSDSGQFGCSGYGNNIDSSWLITAASDQRITLTFTSFDTELYYDYIKVYDGNNNHASVLGSFSGNTLPAPLTSSGSNLYVTFHSDSSVSSGYAGFSAGYTTFGSFQGSACSASAHNSLTTSTGDFGCDGYSNNVDITWSISSFASIYLYFPRFDTESNFDFVSVYDGTSSSATRLGRWSGTHAGTATSSGTNLFVEFTSDSSVTRTGFTGAYSTVANGNNFVIAPVAEISAEEAEAELEESQ